MAEIIINLDKVTVSLASRPIFTELSWEIQSGQRVGLVGANGVGKSTLLKLIAQEITADSGNIFRKSGLTWGRLEQEPDLSPDRTVWQELLTAVPQIAVLENQMHQLEQKMGDSAVFNHPASLDKVIAAHEKLLIQYEQLGGHSYESRLKESLTQVGISKEQWELPVTFLSGGQKKLVLLAKQLVQQPDLLLLDEPDNHLDLAAKQQLERVINSYKGCVVIISHDRYLLDGIATHIAELDAGKLTLYIGNYTAYATERQIRRLRQQQLYVAQQKEITRIEAAIARFELWASMVVDERHIRQARSRQKMLERMDKIEKVTEAKRINLELAGWRGSNKVIELVNVRQQFENGRILFNGLHATLWHGERVGLVGPNGAGKSFLLKQLLNPEDVASGQIKIGPSCKIGYYAQQHETLDYNQTLIETIRHTAPLSQEAAVAFLNRFLYTYAQMQQPIGRLSGGERSRLQLAKLVLERPNLLILDEPTNNLDIASIEVLEETLDEFVGTVLVISHDRYFLDKVVDRVLQLKNGQLTEFTGGYTDYLDAIG